MIRRPILPLPDAVVAQVAAGEVIERPASLVKELIENSLDAGATEILIEVEKGGRDSLLVADNGFGIPQHELSAALQPHATSKLETVDDLLRLRSYGFRGEALASIAAVSSIRIESKVAEASSGAFIEKEAEQVAQGLLGMNTGTRVIIRRLFQRIPARSKFLKGEVTEWRHILSMVHAQACTHPEVGWKVIHNGKCVLDLPAGQNRMNRLLSLIGEDIAHKFLPIEKDFPHFRISGYISLPQFATSRRQHSIFVNNRPIESVLIGKALRSAYSQLVELDAQPAFFLWLELPPETVDVNIHPRKETVRFLDERTVQKLVFEAARETLNVTEEQAQAIMSQHAWLIQEGSTGSALGKTLKKKVLSSARATSNEIWQAHDVFLVQETESGVRFIDQHAAHERILFERFVHAYSDVQGQGLTHELEEALSFSLNTLEYQLLEEYLEELQKIGFSIELWNHNTVVVRSVPEFFLDRDIPLLIQEVLHDLEEGTSLEGIDTATHKLLAYLACRSAIKAGQTLSPEEREKLLTELLHIPHNFTCPHGRPIRVDFSLEQLYTLFKRR